MSRTESSVGPSRLSSPLVGDRVLLLGLLASLLAGCAIVGGFTADRPPPPEHFAEHDTSHVHFDLHWTLERPGDRVVVWGIVVASRISRILDVTVEAAGLDEGGRVVSRGLSTTYGGAMGRDESRPFLIRLRPSGREATFTVRVWHFTYEHGTGRAARASHGALLLGCVEITRQSVQCVQSARQDIRKLRLDSS